MHAQKQAKTIIKMLEYLPLQKRQLKKEIKCKGNGIHRLSCLSCEMGTGTTRELVEELESNVGRPSGYRKIR